jgi:protein-tyrosine phosphatase
LFLEEKDIEESIERMTIKLLFVCLGNICRSPSAEGIMNRLIADRGLSDLIQCDSAGTSDYHVGAAPDIRMTQAASKSGVTLTGRSRQFEILDFNTFDFILAMDRANYQSLILLDRTGQFKDKVRLMCDFCQTFSEKDVPDPYYGGPDGFKYVIDLLMDACNGLLEYVIQNHPSANSPHADSRQ